jgi:hypothetical protein
MFPNSSKKKKLKISIAPKRIKGLPTQAAKEGVDE